MLTRLSALGCLLLLCTFVAFASRAASNDQESATTVLQATGVEVAGLPGIADDLKYLDEPFPKPGLRKKLPNAPVQESEEPPLSKPAAAKQPNVITCDELVAKKVTVQSGDGKYVVLICAWDTGVGIFSSAKDSKECLTLVHQKGMSPYVGLHDGGGAGCPIALTMDQGLPQIQIVANEVKTMPDGTFAVQRSPRWITTNGLLSLTTK